MVGVIVTASDGLTGGFILSCIVGKTVGRALGSKEGLIDGYTV